MRGNRQTGGVTEEPRDRLAGAPRLVARIGAVEGIAVLLLVSVVAVIYGLASHTTWPVVVGAILFVLTVLDAAILSWVRRRTRR
jgi:membrane protein YdbS with pleckstrin-like domain